jgi:hypothetical protein
LIPVLIALVVGLSMGVLIGLAIGAQSGTTALLALVGVVGGLVTTVLGWTLTESSDRRKERAAQVLRDRERYGDHADELNAHVFAPCATAMLTPRHVPYPDDERLSRGIQTAFQGVTGPISGLPNWGFGLSHMLADLPVRDAWNRAIATTEAYFAALDQAMALLLDRLDAAIGGAYGPEMYLRRSRMDADRLTWCDTPQLALVMFEQRSNGGVRRFDRPLSAEEQRGEPRLPGSGGMIFSRGNVFLQGQTAAESDPGPLQRAYDAALNDPTILLVIDSALAAEREAKTRVAEFAEIARLYSNEILTSHTFVGRCRVCMDYVLA